jgi:hypothetical protein
VDVGAIALPIVTAIVGAGAGAGSNAWFAARRQRQEEEARRREALAEAEKSRRLRLAELRSLLRRSKTLFVDQVVLREQLMDEIRRNHPDFQPSRPGYEYWFSEAHSLMSSDELRLHQMIAGYTEDDIVPANQALRRWIADNRDLIEGREDLGRELDLVEQHLDGWFVKFNRVYRAEPSRALVYLADEDDLGPRFPQDVDAVVESAYRDAGGSATADD